MEINRLATLHCESYLMVHTLELYYRTNFKVISFISTIYVLSLCQRSNIKPSFSPKKVIWPVGHGSHMGEWANNSALEKLTLNFPKICMAVLQGWSKHMSEKSPWKSYVSCKDTGDCKGKETHLKHINDLSYWMSLGVTQILEIRYGIQAALNMDIGKISC